MYAYCIAQHAPSSYKTIKKRLNKKTTGLRQETSRKTAGSDMLRGQSKHTHLDSDTVNVHYDLYKRDRQLNYICRPLIYFIF